MLFILINFACSIVEAFSYFLIMNATFKHYKKNPYIDILMIVSIGFFYGLLNDYGVAPLGTILGIFAQIAWSGFVLEGKISQKCLASCIWFIFIIPSDWLVLLTADFLHITGDTPIIAALQDYPILRANMMIISKFLLMFMTIAYVYYRQCHKQKTVVVTKFMLLLTGIFYLSQMALLVPFSLNKVKASDSLYTFSLLLPIITSITYVIIIFLFSFLYRSNMTNYHYEKLIQKNRLEKRHYENMKLLEEELTDWKHEIINHFQSLQQLISTGDYDTLKKKADAHNLFPADEYLMTGNAVFDLVLTQKINFGKQKNIPFQVNIQKIGTLAMEDTDIVCLMSNLLDNACGAAQNLPSEKRYVYLEIKNTTDFLLIKAANPYKELYTDSKNRLRTSKNNYMLHGRGMGCMESISKKYNGTLQYNTENNIFTVKIALKIL